MKINLSSINPYSAVGRCLQIYKEFDNQAANYDSKCKNNCCLCCYDYFYVSEAEFYTILYYIIQNNGYNEELKKLSIKAKRLSIFLKKYVPLEYDKIYGNDTGRSINYYLNPIVDGVIRLGKPCIFLNSKNKCSIYEVRPLICRKFGTIIDSRYGKSIICENVHYSHTLDYSQTNNAQKSDNIFFVGKYFRIPKPLLYWFSEIIPLLELNNYNHLKKMCEKNYDECIRNHKE